MLYCWMLIQMDGVDGLLAGQIGDECIGVGFERGRLRDRGVPGLALLKGL